MTRERSATVDQHEVAWAKIHDLLAAGYWTRAREIFDQAVSSTPPAKIKDTAFYKRNAAPQDDLKGSEALHRPLAGLAASSHRPDATPAVAAPSAAPTEEDVQRTVAEIFGALDPASIVRRIMLAPSAIPSTEALQHIQIWTPYDGKPTITLGIPGRGFWSYYPANGDPDGAEFMLAFKEHFGIKGVDRG